MNQPCANQLKDCDCSDSPVSNLTAEGPDFPQFIAFPNIPFPPPIGAVFSSPFCNGWCISDVSQQDAQDCANRQQVDCVVTDNGSSNTPGCDTGWCSTPRTQRSVFLSAEQHCSVLCPDQTDTFNFTLPSGAVHSPWSQADADARAESLCRRRAADHFLCLTDVTVPETCVNEEYFFAFLEDHGSAVHGPITWNMVSGSLPLGLNFDTQGFLSGTPTQSGSFTFDISATAASGETNHKSFTLHVVEITTTSLPDATQATAYSQSLSENGGTSPLSWQVTSGSLPPGLSLDETTGIISGTPTTAGDYPFTVTLQTDAT